MSNSYYVEYEDYPSSFETSAKSHEIRCRYTCSTETVTFVYNNTSRIKRN